MDNINRLLNEVILSTEGVSSIVFPGIIYNKKDKGIELDIYVYVAYGKVIPEIAWNIQENVKHLFESNNMNLYKANIHIEGIDIKEA